METVGETGVISILRSQRLGSGRTCKVFVGQYDKQKVAVKRIQRDDNRIEREANFLRELRHPNIVHYHYFDKDQDFEYLVMEQCFYSLQGYLCDNLPFDDMQLLRDLALGLQYLHDRNVIHRNIHTSNILLVGDIGDVKAKLADFGIAKVSPDGLSISCPEHTGSVRFLNPEEAKKERVGKRSDIYSLGWCFFTILSRQKSPFGEDDVTITNAMRKGNEPDLSAIHSSQRRYAKDLIKWMLQPNKAHRPYISDVLTHCAFWDARKAIDFLQAVSERMKDYYTYRQIRPQTERICMFSDWLDILFQGMTYLQVDAFYKMLDKYPENRRTVKGLIRAIRNWSHHFRELPNEVKQALGGSEANMTCLLQEKFPTLLPEVCRIFKQDTDEVVAQFFI